jgi:hypothetical protein
MPKSTGSYAAREDLKVRLADENSALDQSLTARAQDMSMGLGLAQLAAKATAPAVAQAEVPAPQAPGSFQDGVNQYKAAMGWPSGLAAGGGLGASNIANGNSALGQDPLVPGLTPGMKPGMKKGGLVLGPPPPPDGSDNIDAKLQAHEFVLPRATVAFLGLDFLNRIVEQTTGKAPVAGGLPTPPDKPGFAGGGIVETLRNRGKSIDDAVTGMVNGQQVASAETRGPAAPEADSPAEPGGFDRKAFMSDLYSDPDAKAKRGYKQGGELLTPEQIAERDKVNARIAAGETFNAPGVTSVPLADPKTQEQQAEVAKANRIGAAGKYEPVGHPVSNQNPSSPGQGLTFQGRRKARIESENQDRIRQAGPTVQPSSPLENGRGIPLVLAGSQQGRDLQEQDTGIYGDTGFSTRGQGGFNRAALRSAPMLETAPKEKFEVRPPGGLEQLSGNSADSLSAMQKSASQQWISGRLIGPGDDVHATGITSKNRQGGIDDIYKNDLTNDPKGRAEFGKAIFSDSFLGATKKGANEAFEKFGQGIDGVTVKPSAALPYTEQFATDLARATQSGRAGMPAQLGLQQLDALRQWQQQPDVSNVKTDGFAGSMPGHRASLSLTQKAPLPEWGKDALGLPRAGESQTDMEVRRSAPADAAQQREQALALKAMDIAAQQAGRKREEDPVVKSAYSALNESMKDAEPIHRAAGAQMMQDLLPHVQGKMSPANLAARIALYTRQIPVLGDAELKEMGPDAFNRLNQENQAIAYQRLLKELGLYQQ